MAITAELMAIIMNINDQTHRTINFKKRKVMDDFNRNLIINGILMDFQRNLMVFMCSSDRRQIKAGKILRVVVRLVRSNKCSI